MTSYTHMVPQAEEKLVTSTGLQCNTECLRRRDQKNLLESHRILSDGLAPLLLAGLCRLEALGEPEAPVFVTAFSGGHHPHAQTGQHPHTGQHQVDGVEFLSGLAVHATWQERGHGGQDVRRRPSGIKADGPEM